jgi:hypothetical protein
MFIATVDKIKLSASQCAAIVLGYTTQPQSAAFLTQPYFITYYLRNNRFVAILPRDELQDIISFNVLLAQLRWRKS